MAKPKKQPKKGAGLPPAPESQRGPSEAEIAERVDQCRADPSALSAIQRFSLAAPILWLIDQGLASEWPRPVPEAPNPNVTPLGAQGTPTPKAVAEESRRNRPRPKLMTVGLDQVEERETEWLWPGRVPLGTPCVILGRQGDGKSTLTGWIAANVTTGRPWPDSPDDNESGSVLILQAEESAGRSLKPRMVGFGADMKKVGVILGVDRGDGEESWFNLASDCEALGDECERRGDVRLIIVDPLGSYIRGISGYNENEVRTYLQPLFRLAEDFNLAILLVVHPNKDSEKDILDRVSGSGAITQMARMSWYLSEDPTTPGRRLLSRMKGNLFGACETAIAVHYDSRRRVITWFAEPVNLNARQVDHLLQKKAREEKLSARPGRDPELQRKAQETLLELLKAGPLMQSAAQDQALNRGVKESTFRAALKRLIGDDGRVTRERRGEDGRWWVLLTPEPAGPDGTPPADAPGTPPETGPEGGPEPSS